MSHKVQLEKVMLKSQYYKDLAASLSSDLKKTKIFLNMVIHDLRNPTNQIKFAIEQALGQVEKVIKKSESLENLSITYLTSMKDRYKELQHRLVEKLNALKHENDELKAKLIEMTKVPVFKSQTSELSNPWSVSKQASVAEKGMETIEDKIQRFEKELDLKFRQMK